jgi:5S rRNA maturation endonuclease (ribonuclease M5)
VAKCPGHDDRKPSLSLSDGEDGRALLHCHAGCEPATILKALGLETRDLFPERLRSATARETRYDVRDAAGAIVAVHVRHDRADGKTFHWERNGSAGLDGLRVAALPLYGSELLGANVSGPVFVVEGEKATDALRRHGFAAVGTVCGAAATPGAETLAVLRGRDVVQWPDADEPGRRHMDCIAERLVGIAASVRVFQWPPAPKHGDAFDFFAQGGTANDVAIMLPHAKPFEQARPATASHCAHSASGARIVRLSSVQERPLSWLWLHRIPLSMVTLVGGHGGKGKTTIVLDIGARVTRGVRMPDGTPGLAEPAGVVILSAEDALDSVLVPRLKLAGADLDRVVTIAIPTPEGDERPPLVTPEDLSHVEAAVQEVGARLVVFDPLVAFADEGANLHHNQDARRVTARLHALAERAGIAVVGVHHFNRGQQGEAAHRLTGSLGLVNAARSALIAAPDPDDASGERMVLALAKHNLAPRSTPSLAYRLSVPAGAEHPKVAWDGPCPLTADDLVSVPASPEERSTMDAAMQLLRDRLEGCAPVKVSDLLAEARANGISERTLGRAKLRLPIRAERHGGAAGAGWWEWVWLPPKPLASLGPSIENATVPAKDANGEECGPPPVGEVARRIAESWESPPLELTP